MYRNSIPNISDPAETLSYREPCLDVAVSPFNLVGWDGLIYGQNGIFKKSAGRQHTIDTLPSRHKSTLQTQSDV